MLLDIQVKPGNLVETWTDDTGTLHLLLRTNSSVSRAAVAWAVSVKGSTRQEYDANRATQSTYIAVGHGGGIKLVR